MADEVSEHMASDDDSAAAGAAEPHASGREIINPVSGERIVIRVGGAETGGELLVFDLFLPAGAHVPAGHVHPAQEERFTVLAGAMRFRLGPLGLRTFVARAGETVRLPAGTAHWFGAAGAAPAHAVVEVRPALRMQELFETTEAIGQQRRGRGGRGLGLMQLAHLALEYRHEVAAPFLPTPLTRLLFAPLARLSRYRTAPAPSAASTGEVE